MRGFSTLEILLALTIMTTSLSAVVLVELKAPQSLADGSKELTATDNAASLLESELQHGLTDFKDVEFVASSTFDGVTTSLNVQLLPDGITKTLASLATWTDTNSVNRTIVLHGIVTDFADAFPSSCSDVLVGDWTRPQMHTFSLTANDLLPSTLTSTYPLSSLAVASSTLIGTIGTTSSKTDPTLFVFDISFTTLPRYEGSVDNASSTRQGLNAAVVSGNYVFVASANKANFSTCKQGPSCAQLQVFNISNPSTPIDIDNFELPTSTTPFAVGSGGQAIGKSIAYANGYVYLGLAKTANGGDEFNVIDVRNASAPTWVGGFPIGRTINRIVIRGSLAYLATDDPERELIILNVSNPTNIALVGSYDAPGASDFGYGSDLALVGTTLALGRTYSPNASGLALLSLASTSPEPLSSEQIFSVQNPTSVQALLSRGFLLFLLTNDSLELFDLHDPTGLQNYANFLNLPDSSIGSALACRDNAVYVASVGTSQNGYLSIVTGS